MKKAILPALILMGTVSLTGCSYLEKWFSPIDTNKTPEPQYQGMTDDKICTELKRKIIFSQSDLNMNVETRLATQKARLYQQYRKYNCKELEKRMPTRN